MGDFFGGSINGHKRTKSTTSRGSMYTQSTSTGDGSLTKFSHRSNSTAATSVMDDDSSFFSSRSSRSKKLLKRGKSPGGSTSDSDRSPSRLAQSFSFSRSRSPSRERHTDYSDVEEDDDGTVLAKTKELDSSEWDLAMQLELARRNSKNQHGKQVPSLPIEAPVEATIYEGS